MYKRLKLQFTLLCSILTGTILFVALILSYSFSTQQLSVQADGVINYQSQMIERTLFESESISHTEIRAFELAYQVDIFLYDNGNYISIAEAKQGPQKEVLRAAVENQIDTIMGIDNFLTTKPSSYINRTAKIIVDGSNEHSIKIIAEPKSSYSWYSMVVVFPPITQGENIHLTVQYAVVFIILLMLLIYISWFLAGKAIQPIEAVQQAQKEFVATASHELKSPLAVISASSEFIANNEIISQQTDLVAHLQNISGETTRMAQLVDDLLLLSSSESGSFVVKKELTNTENLLISIYDCFTTSMRRNMHPFNLVLPDATLPDVFMDSQRVAQILSILLNNTIDHTASGTPVEITASAMGTKLTISIIDHGQGIPDSEKDKIFNKFYQAETSHRNKANFGLGLSVAAQLATLHNTHIEVTDTLGGGTTMTLRFPF